jgi:hypothetical protein
MNRIVLFTELFGKIRVKLMHFEESRYTFTSYELMKLFPLQLFVGHELVDSTNFLMTRVCGCDAWLLGMYTVERHKIFRCHSQQTRRNHGLSNEILPVFFIVSNILNVFGSVFQVL